MADPSLTVRIQRTGTAAAAGPGPLERGAKSICYRIGSPIFSEGSPRQRLPQTRGVPEFESKDLFQDCFRVRERFEGCRKEHLSGFCTPLARKARQPNIRGRRSGRWLPPPGLCTRQTRCGVQDWGNLPLLRGCSGSRTQQDRRLESRLPEGRMRLVFQMPRMKLHERRRNIGGSLQRFTEGVGQVAGRQFPALVNEGRWSRSKFLRPLPLKLA